MVPSARAFVLLSLLAAPAAASIADPPGGTPIEFTVGDHFKIKLKNAMGCEFSYTAVAEPPGIVEVSPESGTQVKGATVELHGLTVGTAMVTITSMDFTCPPAEHSYAVDVLPDFDAAYKEFNTEANAARKQLKLDLKAEYKLFDSEVKALNVAYKDGALDDDTLFEAFHDKSSTLRRNCTAAGEFAYEWVVGTGTQLLLDNAAEFGDAPPGMFAGGCDAFDKFQDSACLEFSKFHKTFDKASKKGITSFEKSGAPIFGQWSILPPLFAGGPLYPVQAAAITELQTLTGPYNFTVKPVTNETGDNGRLLVSGRADSKLTGSFEVWLTREELGQLPDVQTQTPDVVDDEWTADFPDLREGAYTLATKYTDDDAEVALVLHVVRF